MNTVEQSIGHYQLKNLLGAGGMGNVFLGYDPRLEREVAIKCVRLDSNIENGDSYLKKEAKVLAKLNHPNIVQLYDIVEQENQLALIMEYVKGVSFKDVIKSQDYTLKQALVWLSEISLGLHSAHQHKIIHRDLKPENILLNSENKVKIADFGIAKLINSENHSTHNILGSYIAFSPEQASGNKLDCQSDVFSLGIFAYLLLCRKHPFGDSSEPANIISNILSGGVVPPDRENNNITKPIANLIVELLEKRPEDRPNNLQEVSQLFFDSASQHNDTKVFNVIATDTVIEKKDNSKSHTRIASSIYSDFTKVVTSQFNKPTLFYSVFIAICILSTLLAFIFYPTKINNHYVAVVEPKLTSQMPLKKEDYLVKSSVFNAFEQSIVTTQGLKLIPRFEISEVGQSPSEIGLQTGADSVLSSHIECFSRSCNITLVRLDAGDWSVLEQKQWSVLKDQLLNSHDISAQRAVGLFADAIAPASLNALVDEESYKKYIEIRYNIANTSNNPDSSLQDIATLIEYNPNYTPLYDLFRNVSLHAYTDSNDSKYLNALEQKLKRTPKTISSSQNIIFNWFEYYLAKGNYSLAQQQIQYLQDNYQNEVKVLEMQASLALEKGDYVAAINFLKKVLSYRKSRNVLYEMALAHWLQGDLNAAKHHIDALLDIAPEDYYGLSLKAGIALSEGNLTLAKNTYNTLLSISDDSDHYTNLGLVHLLLKEYDDAKALFIKALDKNPKHFTLQINVADVELLLGNKNIALSNYRKILATLTHPKDLEEMLVLPQAHAQLGDYEQAILALHKLIEHSPDDPNTAFTAALTYTLAGEYTSATVNIKKAIKFGMSPIWFTLPWFSPLCEKVRIGDLIGDVNKVSLCTNNTINREDINLAKEQP
ncbi:serine/threonine-protein kinase [Agarilytica rhodophyticola]|uniref:serine/threonine-protein kinase n=1 Tax=Agarilytica rhodophyticola TaxID=1737490 RepID=UPI000B34388B|nr:serine/threonine-protein kinase [Agarilytica rhodophyticola]